LNRATKKIELAFLIHHSDSGGCRWEQSEDPNLADNMGTIQELQMVLIRKDEQIRDLKTMLQQKEEEIQQLQSHLDKYQSVFSLWKPGQAVSRNSRTIREPRKQRAQGISAEPQEDFTDQTFPIYPKSERSVEIYL
jgi:hypothetical protein